MECTFMKSADDIKLKGATDARKGRAALQRALDRLEQRVNRNPTKFNRNPTKFNRNPNAKPCTWEGRPPALIKAGGWGAAPQEQPGGSQQTAS